MSFWAVLNSDEIPTFLALMHLHHLITQSIVTMLPPPSLSLPQTSFFFSAKKKKKTNPPFRPLLCSYRNKGRHLWASFCPSFPLYSPEFLRHACASAGALFCISVLIIPCLINTLQARSMHLSLHAWVRDWRTGWVNAWMAGW